MTILPLILGPIQALKDDDNIEDCDFHDLEVTWDADLNLLEIFLDCELRLSYTGDVVNNIFGGNPWVFWGFSGATGASNNHQEVCFEYTSFLDDLKDYTICPGGNVQLRAKEGFPIYQWEPPTGLSDPNISNPVASPDNTTEYTLNIWGECNRFFQEKVTVFVDGDSLSIYIGPDTTICEGELAFADASNDFYGTFFDWSNGSTESIVPLTESGVYEVTVSNFDCITTDRLNARVIPIPNIQFPEDTIACENEPFILDVTVDDGAYLWDNGKIGPFKNVGEAGTYIVEVSNRCGIDKDTIQVDFEPCPILSVPNVFSPNGDNNNDVIFVPKSEYIRKIESFQIFDRWGTLTYQALFFDPGDETVFWDGKLSGKTMPIGVYIYKIEATLLNGQSRLIYGDITLIR